MHLPTPISALLALTIPFLPTLTSTTPLEPRKSSPKPYAPIYGGQCPSTLVRTASQKIAPDEAAYVKARKQMADASLSTWLQGINKAYNLNGDSALPTSGGLPTLGLTSSGGGWRAFLLGAGIISGFDSRETNGQVSGVSGLWQALTYHGT